jgi:hypothetical protein
MTSVRLVAALALLAGASASAQPRAPRHVSPLAARTAAATASASSPASAPMTSAPMTSAPMTSAPMTSAPVAAKPVVATPVARTVAAAAAPAPKRAPVTSVTIERETFGYGGVGRRDPFKSLMTTAELRPMLAELRLVAVAYDPSGGSVAILRDMTTKAQHRVRTGSTIGRMRVAAIRPKAVVFTIEELGFNRQETLGLNDSTAVRGK